MPNYCAKLELDRLSGSLKIQSDKEKVAHAVPPLAPRTLRPWPVHNLDRKLIFELRLFASLFVKIEFIRHKEAQRIL